MAGGTDGGPGQASLLGELAGPDIHLIENFGDLDAELFAEERAVVSAASAERRAEFTTCRTLARAGLAELGVAAAPLLPGGSGEPLWPPGVIGSLTHCVGYRAAAVAARGHAVAIGIDAEPDEPLPNGVLELITDESERAHLASLRSRPPVRAWPRLLFSAKEAVYKAWFPLTGTWLGFDDVTMHVDTDGRFTARVRPAAVSSGAPASFDGRWTARRGLVGTLVTVVSRS